MDAHWRELMFENYVFSLGRIARLGVAAHSERVGPWLCIDAGLGESSFNIAVLVGETQGTAAAALKRAQRWFDGRGVNSRFDLRSWADAELIAAAARSGYHHWWTEPALLLDSIPERFGYPAGFETRLLRTPSDAAAYSRLDSEEHDDHAFQASMAKTAIGMPGCQLLLGISEGVPVARSMANTTGEMVGIHNVYVPPSLRKRGFGAAVTAGAIMAGREAGARAACLEATEIGLPVYLRMGFRRVGDYIVLGKSEPPAW
ncbi:MAG: GNAT family N-acetyltransferase [Tepidiformaceae bacterium]